MPGKRHRESGEPHTSPTHSQCPAVSEGSCSQAHWGPQGWPRFYHICSPRQDTSILRSYQGNIYIFLHSESVIFHSWLIFLFLPLLPGSIKTQDSFFPGSLNREKNPMSGLIHLTLNRHSIPLRKIKLSFLSEQQVIRAWLLFPFQLVTLISHSNAWKASSLQLS